jgi:hypothetical protein
MHMALKRKMKWLGAAIATLALCAAAAWFLRPAGRPITVETYERLRPGMPRDEVEVVLGGPGGTCNDFSRWLNNRSPTIGSGSDLLNLQWLNGQWVQPRIKYWYQDSGIIIVRFDADDRVADKQFLTVRVSTSRQMVIRLRERMGW